MDSSVSGAKIESTLADLRDLPLGRGADLATATVLADRIMPQEGVSAFNSAL
jgi:hypothetical protein